MDSITKFERGLEMVDEDSFDHYDSDYQRNNERFAKTQQKKKLQQVRKKSSGFSNKG